MRDSGGKVRIGARGIVAAVAVFLLAAFARPARAQSAAGTVSSASGQVQIERGGATLAATPGTPVNQGDKIVSGADGYAVIILTDESELTLRPATTIALDQYTTGGATPTRVALDSGTLRSVVNGTPRRSGQLPSAYAQRDRDGARHGFLHRLHPKLASTRQPPRNLPLHGGGRDRRHCQLGAGCGARQRR